MHRVWIYCRDSLNKDHLQKQQVKLEQFAREHGCEVAGVTAEVGDYSDYNRQALREIMEAARAGKMDTLLITGYGRIGHNGPPCVQFVEELEKFNVNVHPTEEPNMREWDPLLLAIANDPSGVGEDNDGLER